MSGLTTPEPRLNEQAPDVAASATKDVPLDQSTDASLPLPNTNTATSTISRDETTPPATHSASKNPSPQNDSEAALPPAVSPTTSAEATKESAIAVKEEDHTIAEASENQSAAQDDVEMKKEMGDNPQREAEENPVMEQGKQPEAQLMQDVESASHANVADEEEATKSGKENEKSQPSNVEESAVNSTNATTLPLVEAEAEKEKSHSDPIGISVDNTTNAKSTLPSSLMEQSQPSLADDTPKNNTKPTSGDHSTTQTTDSTNPSVQSAAPLVSKTSDRLDSSISTEPSTKARLGSTISKQAAPTPTSQPLTSAPIVGTSALANAPKSSEMLAPSARRSPPIHNSIEAQSKAREEEILRLQKENEDMRLMWLSLPANDHITYYSDTEEDASSTASDNLAPLGTYGGMPFLSGLKSSLGNGKRKRDNWLQQEEERESSDSADEDVAREEYIEERRNRTGNRGNKLQKGSRWIRRGKLGLWTEAKNEKEMHDRFTTRVKAVQRAGVESLLFNAPGPKAIQEVGSTTRDILEGSDRMLLKDVNSTGLTEENLNSTSLAPALLRPILSARALLESHTLRHTFRNPHIGALSKTALDLRESEGQLSRALGRCLGATEKINAYQEMKENGEIRVNGSDSKYNEIDSQAIGVDGTDCTSDELNPAFVQLDQLFITKEGLPIPLIGAAGEELPPNEMQAVLSVAQQRDVVRAALECLHDLGVDSLEYVERLDEVRGRLEAVKRRRTQVWEALRLWAIQRECGPDDVEGGEAVEEEVIEEITSNRNAVKPPPVATSSRRRR